MPKRILEVGQPRAIRPLAELILELQQFRSETELPSEVRETANSMLLQIEAISSDTVDDFMRQFDEVIRNKRINFSDPGLHSPARHRREMTQVLDEDGFATQEPDRTKQKRVQLYDDAKIDDRSFMRLIADIWFALGNIYPRNARNYSGELISTISNLPVPPTNYFVCMDRYHYNITEFEFNIHGCCANDIPIIPSYTGTLMDTQYVPWLVGVDTNKWEVEPNVMRGLNDLEIEQYLAVVESLRCKADRQVVAAPTPFTPMANSRVTVQEEPLGAEDDGIRYLSKARSRNTT